MDGSDRHTGPGPRPRKGMRRGKPDLIRRQQAVEKTKARFFGKEFKLGSNDCWKLARHHLKAMGHPMPGSGRQYTTPAGAAFALKEKNCRNLADVMDLFLERIPPASMLLGDIALLRSEPEEGTAFELGTLMVHLGTTKALGWHPDTPILAVVDLIDPAAVQAAWRA